MMRRFLIGIALVGLVATALPLAASAQYREFSGRINQVDKSRMVVDNRMGDTLSFVPGNPSEVLGPGKTEWSQLRKKD